MCYHTDSYHQVLKRVVLLIHISLLFFYYDDKSFENKPHPNLNYSTSEKTILVFLVIPTCALSLVNTFTLCGLDARDSVT